MNPKSSKIFWFILVGVLLLGGILYFTNCFNTSTSINTSEFDEIVFIAKDQDGKLNKTDITANDKLPVLSKRVEKLNYTTVKVYDVVFENYVIDFKLEVLNGTQSVAKLNFTTNYSRNDSKITTIEGYLNAGGINYTYTDPNAGSIWSSLLPLLGTAVLMVIFFILIMSSQG